MKLFKYLLSLALVATCMFSVSYAQSRKEIKPRAKRGIINDTLLYVKKPQRTVGTKTPTTRQATKKTVKSDVHPRKVKATTKKESAIKPRKRPN